MRLSASRLTAPLASIAGLGLLAGGLAACSSGPSPDPVAEDLAAGLEKADLTGVPLTEPGPIDLPRLYGGLQDRADLRVEVTSVTRTDAGATATFNWAWDVGDQTWRYSTNADLVEAPDGWRVAFAPSVVQSSLSKDERFDVDTIAAERGRITGAGGTPIVLPRDVVRLGLDKTQVDAGQVAASARRIAELLDIDVQPYVARARAAGAKAFVEALVLRQPDAREIDPAYGDVPGAVTIADTLPLAPTREFAAPILGSVGEATAELIEKSDGAISAGDEVGLSGLQARYDEQLRGTPGIDVEAIDPTGSERDLFTAEAVPGEPLKLTLDVGRQERAEQVLAGVPDDVAAALVALDPRTGDILAAASSAGADGQNIATYGQYAPGSTFKVVSALALLRGGLTPESRVECPPTVVVDGKSFKNYDDYPPGSLGTISLREAIAQSCNTAMITSRDAVDDDALADAAAALGLGVDHDLGFPAYFGQVPAPESETEAAADLIGQGTVLASPMAMAAVAASVSAGQTVTPVLLPDQPATQVDLAAPLTRAEATSLRSMMRAVVTEGSGSGLAGLPGELGAKTGTAEYGEPAADGSLPTHAWMIAERGDIAVAVFVETGESGSRTAGPLLEAFLSR